MQKGKVIKSTGSWYQVELATGEHIQCRILGKFRLNGLKLTNPVTVGDEVEIEIKESEGTGMIKNILPRKNYVVRQSPRNLHNLHLMASNIDQAVLIVTIVQPNLKQGFIDRFLLMTEPHDIPVILVFNKADLYEEEDFMVFEALKEIYEGIGYKVLLVSALNHVGTDELKDLFKGQNHFGKRTIRSRKVNPNQ